jgi:hypothetical protein
VRRAPGGVVDDLNVLPAGMKDLEHVFVVREQVEQWREVDVLGHRVDGGGFLGIGDLHQAEFGPIGVLAHELRVDRHEVRFRETRAQIGQFLGIGD